MRRFKSILCISILCAAPLTAAASSPRYIALADSADNYIKAENWDMAEKTILTALRLEPGNFSNSLLLSNLGVVQTRRGNMEEALESFRLGLSIAPHSSVLYSNRARTYLHLGRYDDALADINESIAIDSIQEWPLQMRGFLLLNKDPEGAKRDFNKLLNIYPRNTLALTGLAAVAEKEGDNEEALRLYDKAISIDDDPDIRFSRILLKINMEKYSAASEDISESLERFPQEGELYLLRGYLHKLNFRNEEAAIDKKIALDKGADKQIVEQFLP
ncbi:MAG: tetratricopeptide repeat protein [Muribaculaceae bacterium]|nr:tetratricopeptide repeat protein [Muribaculaceae bacterium]